MILTLAQIYVLVVLIVPLALVFMDKMREDIAALVMMVLLGLAQFLGLGVLGEARHSEAATRALAGFSTPEVITLMALFIMTYCLDKYGVTRWLARRLLALGGHSERRLIGLFAVTAAILSLFMNTLAAGALLLPSALDACRQTRIKPSKLLIPIAYGTMLGGAATYLTTANIVVSGLLPLADPPQQPLGFFDFTPTGGIVALTGLAFLIVFGKYLLPDREPPALQVSYHHTDLVKTYGLNERLWEAEVAPHASLVNKTLANSQIGAELGLAVLSVRTAGQRWIPVHDVTYRIQPHDVLLIVGREERANQLRREGLWVHAHSGATNINERDTAVTELYVPPRSNVEGKTLRDLAFRARYGFTAVALWRDNRSYRTDVANFGLRTGDSLLVIGPRPRLDDLKKQQDFIVAAISDYDQPLDAPKVWLTLSIVITALAAMFAGIPVEFAMLTAATVLLITGLLKPEEAYSAIKWRAIFLIAGTISISLAMVETGLAALVGTTIEDWVAPAGPMGLVAGTYLFCALLTQIMGGQIAPLVVGPIAISAAIRLDVNPQAIAVVTAIASSVSFITPLSHPVNILMIAPANYEFKDFVRSGWLLTIICFIALMIAVPLWWDL